MLGEVAGALGPALGVAQAVADGGLHLVVEAGEGEVAQDDGEEVVEIVGDAAGEQAERLEFGGLLEFAFEGGLLLELPADLRGLGADAAAQQEVPGEGPRAADGEQGGQRERAAPGDPGRRPHHDDIGGGARQKLEVVRAAVFVRKKSVHSGAVQLAAHGQRRQRDGGG